MRSGNVALGATRNSISDLVSPWLSRFKERATVQVMAVWECLIMKKFIRLTGQLSSLAIHSFATSYIRPLPINIFQSRDPFGITKMMAQVAQIALRRSAPSFLQSQHPFCSPQRVIMMAQFPSRVDRKNKYCGLKTHHPMQFYIQIINCNASVCLNLVLIFVSTQTDQNW